MTLSADPLKWTIGLVGYGEVGRILAEDLRARRVDNVLACDIKLGGPEEAPLRAHAAQYPPARVAAELEGASWIDSSARKIFDSALADLEKFQTEERSKALHFAA
mgnify:CR=1 FL=1